MYTYYLIRDLFSVLGRKAGDIYLWRPLERIRQYITKVAECHAKLRYVIWRHLTSCYIMPRHSTARHGTSRHAIARHGALLHDIARHGTSRHVTARHGTSLYVIARHCTSRHGCNAAISWESPLMYTNKHTHTHTQYYTTPMQYRHKHTTVLQYNANHSFENDVICSVKYCIPRVETLTVIVFVIILEFHEFICTKLIAKLPYKNFWSPVEH